MFARTLSPTRVVKMSELRHGEAECLKSLPAILDELLIHVSLGTRSRSSIERPVKITYDSLFWGNWRNIAARPTEHYDLSQSVEIVESSQDLEGTVLIHSLDRKALVRERTLRIQSRP